MTQRLFHYGMSLEHTEHRPSGKTSKENVEVVFIPPNCTSKLQPLDVSVNKPLRNHLKVKFTQWYADKVHSQLAAGKAVEEIRLTCA